MREAGKRVKEFLSTEVRKMAPWDQMAILSALRGPDQQFCEIPGHNPLAWKRKFTARIRRYAYSEEVLAEAKQLMELWEGSIELFLHEQLIAAPEDQPADRESWAQLLESLTVPGRCGIERGNCGCYHYAIHIHNALSIIQAYYEYDLGAEGGVEEGNSEQ